MLPFVGRKLPFFTKIKTVTLEGINLPFLGIKLPFLDHEVTVFFRTVASHGYVVDAG